MGQTATTIRMDSDLKRKFDQLCEEFGMSVNTAFNIFAKAVVRTRSIPFSIGVEHQNLAEKGREAFQKLRVQAQAIHEMSLDEINEEIADYRSTKQ